MGEPPTVYLRPENSVYYYDCPVCSHFGIFVAQEETAVCGGCGELLELRVAGSCGDVRDGAGIDT